MAPSPKDLNHLLAEAEWLRRFALHLAKTQDRADDLVQETWVAALRHPPNHKKRPRAWLAAVMRNLHLMKNRGDSRRRQREERASAGKWSAPDDAVVQMEMQRSLADAILALDDDSRTLVVWHYYDQQTSAQIASRLGLEEAAIRKRLSRIRQRLRHRLSTKHGSDWRHQILAAIPSSSSLWPSLTGFLSTTTSNKFVLPLVAAVLIGGVGLIQSGRNPESESEESVNASIANTVSSKTEFTRIEEPQMASTDLPPLHSVKKEPTLRGIVVAPNNEAIAKAELRLFVPLGRQIPGLVDYWETNGSSHAQALSNDDGTFEILAQEGLTYDLVCSAAGFGQNRTADRRTGEWIRIVMEPAAEVWGRITDAQTGLGIPKAIIYLRPGPLQETNEIFSAETNEDGDYRLTDLRPGYFSMRVFSTTHPTVPMETRNAMGLPILKSGERIRMDLQLRRGVSIEGRVTHALLGTAIEGAQVKIQDGPNSYSTQTDADGYFNLTAPQDHHRSMLRFSAAGFGDFQYCLADGSLEGQEVYVALLPARKARGRLVDSKGNPVAGAQLSASANSHYGDYGQQVDRKSTVSAVDGSFELLDLRQDLRHTLLVAHQNFATEVFDFPEGELSSQVVDFGTFVLHPPAGIHGRVIGPDGHPLAGIYVLLSGEPKRRDAFMPLMEGGIGYMSDEGMGFGRISALTNSNGEYSFANVPAGNYFLSAGKKGYLKRGELEVTLDVGFQLENADIILDRGLSISGTVLDSSGNPIGAASVNVFVNQTFHRMGYTICDQNGKFEIWGLEAGKYRLSGSSGFSRTRPQGSLPFTEYSLDSVEAGSQGLRIVLPDLKPVQGTVVGPNGQAVFGAIVCMEIKAGGFSPVCSTNRNGEFEIILPVDRSINLRFWPPVEIADGAFRPIYDADGKEDKSYWVIREGIQGGNPPLRIQLSKLPPLNRE